MNRALLILLPALAACGVESEEGLITDSELNQIQSSRQAITNTHPNQSPDPEAVHVRLAWGYLAGRWPAPGWVNWSGELRLQSPGTLELENLSYFDKHDHLVQTAESDRVAWSSRTLPHFDGLVVKVSPGQPGAALKLTTPPYSREIPFHVIADGLNERLVVDADGHEVSVSSVPDAPCAGFSYGYEKPSSEGWLGFAGLYTDASGAITGRLRFRADGGQIQARLIGADGAQPYKLNVQGPVLATGQGHLDAATGSFEIALVKEDGSALGTVSGIYAPPSYSERGSYQAVVRCPH